MSKVKRKLVSKTILTIMLAIGLTLLIAASVQAVVPRGVVHEGLFELDGNAQDNSTPTADLPDDWESLIPFTTVPTAHEKAKVFVPDSEPADTTYFTGGGSKDVNDINQWAWTQNDQAPDKDEITNAYAAAYDKNGNLILYFGLDRFANNGDAQVGFWFFKNPVTTVGVTGGTFSGVHDDDDLLVLAHFTQGGSVVELQVFRWAGGSLTQLPTPGAIECAPGSESANVCSVVNNATNVPATAPWPYTPKSNIGVPGIFPIGTFFEATLNISALLPDVGCFSSFLSETRSSQSLTAQLKDFALGQFDLCRVAVDKTGDTLSKAGDEVTYNFTITNTGAVTLYLNSVTDTLLNDLTATANAGGCGTLASGASCSFSANRIVLPTDPDPLNNTVTVDYRGTIDLTGQAITASDNHSVDLVHPGMTIDKSGDTLSKAGDTVNYTFVINNTGDVQLNRISVTDTLLGDITNDFPATLAAGQSATITKTRVVLASDTDPLPNTVTATYQVEGLTNRLTTTDDHSVDLVHPNMTIDKSGDTLSKAGDEVNYTFVINNTGDVQLNRINVTDTLLGDITNDFPATLAPGSSATVTKTRVVLSTDPDPLNNTVNANYQVQGLPNILNASDSHSVDLVHPNMTIDKSGDTLSKAGDTVNYTFVINNTGDVQLNRINVTDTLLGDITNDFPATLAPGSSAIVTKTRVVLSTDPDPLNNTVNANYQVQGLPNIQTASESHSVDLVHPDMTLTKSANPTSASVGTTINYTYVINNTGDVQLNRISVIDDVLGDLTNDFPSTLAPGSSATVIKTRAILSTDPNPLNNTVNATYQVNGLPNKLSREASASVTIITVFEGCTPGFWKNHLTVWDTNSDSVSQAVKTAVDAKDATYFYNTSRDGVDDQLFREIFGLTSAQMTAVGLNPDLTMLQAINLGGGGFEKLARHGVAGLLSSVSVNYQFSADEVLTKVNNAVVTLQAEPTAQQLADANNQLEQACPTV